MKNIKDSLSSIQVGNIVKIELHGAGHITKADDSTVQYVDKKSGLFWIGEWDEDYQNDSVYAYSIETGRSVNNYVAGFYNQVISVISV